YFGRVKPMYYYLRNLKQNWKIVSLSLMFIFLNSGALRYLFSEGDGTIPYLTFTIYGESIKNVNGTLAEMYTDYGSNTLRVEVVKLLKEESDTQITYGLKPPPNFDVNFGIEGQDFSEGMKIDDTERPVKDFFNMLKKPTGYCKKMYRAGGQMACRQRSDNIPKMDGQKIICLDPATQVITGSPKTMDCLTLSFGVQYDISFDISIRDINCEVLMFDYDQFSHAISEEDEYVNFFEIGLGTQRVDEYIRDQDRTIQFDTFNNLALNTDSLIMDVEGDEWSILQDMVKQPYLDTIGQIAVEIHAPYISQMNMTQQLEWVGMAKEVFQTFQFCYC
ncbi:hypothetical protein Avbf_03976, partial [Armadillidium vulgare]